MSIQKRVTTPVLLCMLITLMTSLSVSLAQEQGTLKWQFEAQGPLVSSPAIADGVVYVGSDDHHLYALDLETGEQRWAFEAGNMILSSPVVADGVVFFGSDDRHLYALDAANGEVIWSFEADGWVNSPLLADGALYIGIDCTPEDCADFDDIQFGLYAIDANTGALKWKRETAASITSQAVDGEGVIYAADLEGTVYSLDDETGDSVWEFDAGAPVASTLTTLLLDAETLYVGTDQGRFYALDAASGEERWHFDTGGWVYSSPAVDGDVLYLGSADGNLYALDRETGSELWHHEIGAEIGNPTLHNGLLYFGSFDNHLYAFDPAAREVAHSFETDGYILGRTAFTDDAVIFPSSDGCVYALYL